MSTLRATKMDTTMALMKPKHLKREVELWNPPELSPCIEWSKSKNKKGYGKTWFNGSCWQAHRLAYIKAYGDFDRSLCVLHRCDNPSCVNPEHLFLGTHKDNAIDRKQKGRNANQIGNKSVLAKLTSEQVDYIRTSNKTCQQLSEELNVSKSQINKIKNRKCWNS